MNLAYVKEVVNRAIQRGNRQICEILEVDPVNVRELKEDLRDSIITKTAGILATIPKSGDDIDYNQQQISAKIRALLDAPGITSMVKYEDLLKLKLPPVHYNIGHENKRDVGHLVPCPAPCPRPGTCRTMQTPLLIADYIRVQLGKKEKLFENLPPPFVVGSLKENTRLFCYGKPEHIYNISG